MAPALMRPSPGSTRHLPTRKAREPGVAIPRISECWTETLVIPPFLTCQPMQEILSMPVLCYAFTPTSELRS
jgi:hypothetical protein